MAPLPLHKAAFRGNVEGVRQLLGPGGAGDVAARDANRATPMHHAAFKGHVGVVKALLEFGAPVDAVDADGGSPLHNAAFNGHADAVAVLLKSGSAAIDLADVDGATALQKAANNGHAAVVTALLEAGASPDLGDSVDGATALLKAADAGHRACLQALLEHGASPDAVDAHRSTALHRVCFAGRADCVRELLAAGANVNLRDQDDAAPIHNAVYQGHADVVTLLVAPPAERALWRASQAASSASASAEPTYLPVDLECQTQAFHSRPLHFAAFKGFADIVELLLDASADVDARDKKGMTPFLYAVRRGHEDCAELLAIRGADTTARDGSDRAWADMTQSSSMAAVVRGRKSVILAPEQMAEVARATTRAERRSVYQGRVKRRVKRSSSSSRRRLAAAAAAGGGGGGSGGGGGGGGEGKSRRSGEGGSGSVAAAATAVAAPAAAAAAAGGGGGAVSNGTDGSEGGSASRATVLEHVEVDDDDDGQAVVFQRLDRNGFLVDDEVASSSTSSASAAVGARDDSDRALKWTRLFSKWDPVFSHQQGDQAAFDKDREKSAKAKKLRLRCEKGIPARVRGRAWQQMLGTTLTLSEARRSASPNYEALAAAEVATDVEKQIRRDLLRTFPKNILLMHEDGREALYRVLHATAVRNPTVGYCQGMGFVTGMLLMYMPEEDAFWCVDTVLSHPRFQLGLLWAKGLAGLPRCFYVLDKLLEANVVKLYKHLQSEGVSVDMYATQWFLTTFLYNLPFGVVLRIWDLFVYDGYTALYAVSLGLFRIFADRLLAMDFEALFSALQFNHTELVIDADQLIAAAATFRDKVRKQVPRIEAAFDAEEAARQEQQQ